MESRDIKLFLWIIILFLLSMIAFYTYMEITSVKTQLNSCNQRLNSAVILVQNYEEETNKINSQLRTEYQNLYIQYKMCMDNRCSDLYCKVIEVPGNGIK